MAVQGDDAVAGMRGHGFVMTKGVVAEVVDDEGVERINFVERVANAIDHAVVVSSVRQLWVWPWRWWLPLLQQVLLLSAPPPLSMSLLLPLLQKQAMMDVDGAQSGVETEQHGCAHWKWVWMMMVQMGTVGVAADGNWRNQEARKWNTSA